MEVKKWNKRGLKLSTINPKNKRVELPQLTDRLGKNWGFPEVRAPPIEKLYRKLRMGPCLNCEIITIRFLWLWSQVWVHFHVAHFGKPVGVANLRRLSPSDCVLLRKAISFTCKYCWDNSQHCYSTGWSQDFRMYSELTCSKMCLRSVVNPDRLLPWKHLRTHLLWLDCSCAVADCHFRAISGRGLTVLYWQIRNTLVSSLILKRSRPQ